MRDRVAIVGAGRMGLALGAALLEVNAVERLTYFGRALDPPPHPIFDPDGPASGSALEEPVTYRLGPEAPPAGTTIVYFAVPDAKLSEVAHEYGAQRPVPEGCVAMHLAGAISTDVLAPLHYAGYSVGSMHPLQAIADSWGGWHGMIGCAYALAGEPAALAAGRRMVHELAGTAIVVPPALRPIYHASAAVASNFLVTLAEFAARLMVQAGVPESQALPALLPLMRGTLDNLEHLGPAAALTGPIARGDADTVRLHLMRLSATDRSLYSALGRETLRLARAAGLDEERAQEIDALLRESL